VVEERADCAPDGSLGARRRPSIVRDDYEISAGLTRADRNGPDDNLRAAQIIAAATDPDDILLTDSPYLAFLADRLVSRASSIHRLRAFGLAPSRARS